MRYSKPRVLNIRLTEENVRDIIEMSLAGATRKECCAKYGVSHQNITNILKGLNKAHIHAEYKERLEAAGIVKPRQKLTREQVYELWERALDGEHHSDIAKDFGIQANYALQLLRGRAFKDIYEEYAHERDFIYLKKLPKHDAETVNRVIKLRNQGLTHKVIGERLGLSHHTVEHLCRVHVTKITYKYDPSHSRATRHKTILYT